MKSLYTLYIVSYLLIYVDTRDLLSNKASGYVSVGLSRLQRKVFEET